MKAYITGLQFFTVPWPAKPFANGSGKTALILATMMAEIGHRCKVDIEFCQKQRKKGGIKATG